MRKLALAVLVPLALSGCGGGESDAHKHARDRAHEAATYFCTMGPDAPTEARPEEYRRCVTENAARFLKDWERAHPGR